MEEKGKIKRGPGAHKCRRQNPAPKPRYMKPSMPVDPLKSTIHRCVQRIYRGEIMSYTACLYLEQTNAQSRSTRLPLYATCAMTRRPHLYVSLACYRRLCDRINVDHFPPSLETTPVHTQAHDRAPDSHRSCPDIWLRGAHAEKIELHSCVAIWCPIEAYWTSLLCEL